MFDVWMDLKGFDLWMATSLNYIKRRSTSKITTIGCSIPCTFRGLQMTFNNWKCCNQIKWIKLKCLKFCSLNIVDFFARSQKKVDLQLKRFSKIRLIPAFPLLQPHYGNMSSFQIFWGSHWVHSFPIFLRSY